MLKSNPKVFTLPFAPGFNSTIFHLDPPDIFAAFNQATGVAHEKGPLQFGNHPSASFGPNCFVKCLKHLPKESGFNIHPGRFIKGWNLQIAHLEWKKSSKPP